MKNKADAPLINQEIIALYDEYTHAPLPRRAFMKRLSALTGGTAAAYAVLPMLENNYANAQMVKVDDARLTSEKVSFDGAGGKVSGVLSYPKAATGKLGAIIVIHENRGLNPHTEDVARRFALEGFLVLAVDYLSPVGGTPTDEDKARDMISKLDAAQVVGNSVGALKFLKTHAKGNGKVGVVGYCWGGGQVNALAVAAGADLAAGAVYYGASPKAEDVPKIQAPLQVHLASLDERINGMWPAYEAALKAGGKKYEMFMYEGANHAFFNDTNAARYHEPSAKLAWTRTLDHFKKNLA